MTGGILYLGDGSTRYLRHVRTGRVRQERDRVAYRSPFGVMVRTAGTGFRRPELVTITVEVFSRSDYGEVTSGGEVVTYEGEPVWALSPTAGSLEAVGPVLNAIIADAGVTVRVESPVGAWLVEGLQSAVPQPIAGGYRLDLTWLAAGPRMLAGMYGAGAFGAGAFGGS